ncbi:MAG: transcription antitermination factor NusB [Bacteroidetes bacterium]|jgi:N utilization substance protein B|nr:transcription antitermination factor NusB [Bacteroidota bacterium]
MTAKRRRVRERVLQALYACEVSKNPENPAVDELLAGLEVDDVAFRFARSLIIKVNDTSKELDELIRGQVEHWEFTRLAVLDKIILRIAICEFLYFDDIPPKVSINEAIEIARTYSTEKSDKFVNGVLDSVLGHLKSDGKLTKSGRGLLDLPAPRRTRARA